MYINVHYNVYSAHTYILQYIYIIWNKFKWFNYEWGKRTKFLLAVIYGLPRRHSNRSKTFKKIAKIKINYHDHFMTNWIIWNNEPARPGPAQPWRSFMAYFSENMKDRDVKCCRNLYSSLQFVLSNFGIDIFHSLETMSFSAT